MKEDKDNFDKCKEELERKLAEGKDVLIRLTGKVLSGDNADVTSTDGQKKMPEITMCVSSC